MQNEGFAVKISDIIVENRERKDLGDIDALAESINQVGQITPIAVKEAGNGKYVLLAGGRRLEAHKRLERETILVRVYPPSLTELDAKAIELSENINRKDLEWTEELALTREIHRLQMQIHGEQKNYNDGGWSQKKTAALLGRSDAIVSDDLTLADALEAMPELKDLVKSKTEASKLLKKLGDEIKTEQKAAAIKADKGNTPEDIVKEQLIAGYNLQDFFVWAKGQPTGFFDLAEIDPPYGIDLQNAKASDGSRALAISQGYNEIDEACYPAFISSLVTEVYRILKDDSWMILWTSWKWFQAMYEAALSVGFIGNNIPLIWTKSQGQTKHPELYLGSACEPALYLRKGKAQIQKPGRLNVFDYRTVPPSEKTHPTERPIEMMIDILSTFVQPGSMIVSPFLGSGNTILAADGINCTCVGCDLNKVYHDYFVVKVSEGKPGDYNSYGR